METGDRGATGDRYPGHGTAEQSRKPTLAGLSLNSGPRTRFLRAPRQWLLEMSIEVPAAVLHDEGCANVFDRPGWREAACRHVGVRLLKWTVMGKASVGAVYVVAASKDGKTEYWAAATSAKDATTAVQLAVGPAWEVRLTNRRLMPNQLAELNLRPDDVRRLTPLP
jgi:hypothetical protein